MKNVMKRIIVLLLIFAFLSVGIGCGDTKVIDGLRYDTYGIANADEKKNNDIQYRIIVGNVVWSVILVETIIAPIYFVLFSLYEPVGVKDHNKPKGVM